MGPLLFSLYINDLLKTLTAQTNLYADDGAVNLEEVKCSLNADMKALESWLKTNKLQLNTEKTKVMYLSSNPNELKDNDHSGIEFQGTTLHLCEEFKYLGVTINKALKWNDHIRTILHSTYGKLSVLGRGRKFVPVQACLQFYVRTHLEYCSDLTLSIVVRCGITVESC